MIQKIISKRAGKNNLSLEVIGKLCSFFQIWVDKQIFDMIWYDMIYLLNEIGL